MSDRIMQPFSTPTVSLWYRNNKQGIKVTMFAFLFKHVYLTNVLLFVISWFCNPILNTPISAVYISDILKSEDSGHKEQS